jgi:hypothetical protein
MRDRCFAERSISPQPACGVKAEVWSPAFRRHALGESTMVIYLRGQIGFAGEWEGARALARFNVISAESNIRRSGLITLKRHECRAPSRLLHEITVVL